MLLAISCAEQRSTTSTQNSSSNSACSLCHGGSAGNAAPPKALDGSTQTSARGVGAHQAHLQSWLANSLQCEDCHQMPATLDAPGHLDDQDRRAEIVFGAAALRGESRATWDGNRCSNVYCHGATLQGGRHTMPQWTLVDGSQASCDSCHGLPPAPPHPQGDDCSQCHGNVVNQDRVIINRQLHINGQADVALPACGSCHGLPPAPPHPLQPQCDNCHAGATHLNGMVEVRDLTCNTCHGSATSDAPPYALHGESSVTARGVGAHQSHLNSSFAKSLTCVDCHTTPSTIGSPGHMDDADNQAEVNFGALAQVNGSMPQWDGHSCSGSYCHGANQRSPGILTSPNWTTVNGSQAACGTCHGLPPAWHESHFANTAQCETCHANVVGAGMVIINKELHVNGVTDMSQTFTCTDCHL